MTLRRAIYRFSPSPVGTSQPAPSSQLTLAKVNKNTAPSPAELINIQCIGTSCTCASSQENYRCLSVCVRVHVYKRAQDRRRHVILQSHSSEDGRTVERTSISLHFPSCTFSFYDLPAAAATAGSNYRSGGVEVNFVISLLHFLPRHTPNLTSSQTNTHTYTQVGARCCRTTFVRTTRPRALLHHDLWRPSFLFFKSY